MGDFFGTNLYYYYPRLLCHSLAGSDLAWAKGKFSLWRSTIGAKKWRRQGRPAGQ